MDPQSIPDLILFGIDDSFVNIPRCSDDTIAILLGHLCCRVLVRDCGERAHSIPFCIHDLNVGRSLLMEERLVDRRRNLYVHLIWEWHLLVSP